MTKVKKYPQISSLILTAVALAVLVLPTPAIAQEKPIPKCEQNKPYGNNIQGRLKLMSNGMAWMTIKHDITEGKLHGLQFRAKNNPYLALDIRVDKDGTVGRINSSIYLSETWSNSRKKYVTGWKQNFSYGDVKLFNTPINILGMTSNGEHKALKTSLGLGAGGKTVDGSEFSIQDLYEQLTSGSEFKSTAVNASVPSEYVEIRVDFSDVPNTIKAMREELVMLKQKQTNDLCKVF